MDVLPFDIEQINTQLLSKFGKWYGHQKFRIVWSDDQIEVKKTMFWKGLYLPFPRVETVKKYHYIKERWVFEIWVPHRMDGDIIAMDGGTYEPVYTFQDKDGNALRPVWKAAEFLGLMAEGKFRGPKRNEAMDLAEHEAQVEKEAQEFEDMLGLGHNFGNQSDAFVAPVFIDSTKSKARIE